MIIITWDTVDLKYITPSQVIETTYEGEPRRFCITAKTFVDTAHTSQLWTVGWDTSVSIVANPVYPDNTITSKPSVEESSSQSALDAYATVGGMAKQITQIRDLLEIPLTHPELFQHFGL